MKLADDVTGGEVDLSEAVVEIRGEEDNLPGVVGDTVVSTMFAVPCWWSWKIVMLKSASAPSRV
jgi:hypothetical protein